jgi:hypothetical protein
MSGATAAQVKAIIRAMPAHVPAKITRLKRAESAASSASEAHWLERQKLNAEVQEKRRLLNDWKAEEHEGYDVKTELAEAEAELDEAKTALDDHRATHNPPKNVLPLEDVHGWIASQKPKQKWRPNIPEVSIPKDSSAKSEYSKRCAETDAIKASIRSAEIAPLPEDEAFAKGVKTVDKIAAKGAPDIRGLFRLSKPHAAVRAQQGDIAWPQQYIGSESHDNGFAYTVWLFRDQIVERLRKDVAALARPNALSIPEREQKIAALNLRLLDAERLEEATFLLAAKEDPSLQRRKVDMRALLQIEEIPAEAKPKKSEPEFG